MMRLDEEDTVVIKSTIELLDETQSIFCADHCEVCPIHAENSVTCIITRTLRCLNMVLGNYGAEEEEEE